MKEIYADYFLQILKKNSNVELDERELNGILEEIAMKGGIEKIAGIVEKYLQNLSNRDFVKFDEKYVKIIFYSITRIQRFHSICIKCNSFYVRDSTNRYGTKDK